MRATSVMRFVIFGAAGFGIGWAIAGLFNVVLAALFHAMFQPWSEPPGWVIWPAFLSWFFAGICGGAALGLALRSWRSVITLALAGGVGFGLGLFLFSVVAFLSGLSVIGVAMGVGLFGGILLGLTFEDWKWVVLLGLVGMVGFGAGGALTAALGMPFVLYSLFGEVNFGELWRAPLLLLQHSLVQVVVGLIGGASLGAALGYLENRKLAEGRRRNAR